MLSECKMATFSHHGRLAKTSFRCHSCFSTEFYEDHQGSYNCSYCHVQSQDFLPESHEAEEGVVFSTIGGRMMSRRMHTPRQAKGPITKQIIPNPELFEFLRLYQYVLQMCMNIIVDILFLEDIVKGEEGMLLSSPAMTSHTTSRRRDTSSSSNASNKHGASTKPPPHSSSSTQHFASSSTGHTSTESSKSTSTYSSQYQHEFKQRILASLKTTWLQYLRTWQSSTSSNCMISQAFCSTANLDVPLCQCKVGDYQHPVFPTKPLLLGFLYLTLRQYRLDVTTSDLISWCERGLLPYNNLWEVIPKEQKQRITYAYRYIFTPQHSGVIKFITSANIWYHTTSLAESLDIPLPPLNAPLVAAGMIQSMTGNAMIADLIFCQYAKISQLFTTGLPMEQASSTNQHFIEPIMATVMLAWMMCPDWQTWTFLHSHPIVAPMAATTSITASQSSCGTSSALSSLAISSSINTNRKKYLHQALRRISIPTNLLDLQSIPRSQLPLLLSQLRDNLSYFRIVRHSPLVGTNFKFNRTILEFFSSIQFHPMDISMQVIKSCAQHGGGNDGNDELESRFSLGQALLGSFQSKHELSFIPSHQRATTMESNTVTSKPSELPSTISYASNLQMSSTAWYGGSMYEDKLSPTSRQYEDQLLQRRQRIRLDKKSHSFLQQKLAPTTSDVQESDDEVGSIQSVGSMQSQHRIQRKVVYLSHARHSQDVTGLRPMSYTILLERCAKYLHVAPMVVHAMVDQLDRQVAELVLRGQITKEQSWLRHVEEKRIHFQQYLQEQQRKHVHAVDAQDIERYAKYRKKSDQLLPLIREVGLSGVLPRFDEVEAEEILQANAADKPARKRLKQESLRKVIEKKDIQVVNSIPPMERSYWHEINELLDTGGNGGQDEDDSSADDNDGNPANMANTVDGQEVDDVHDGLVGRRQPMEGEEEESISSSASSTIDDSSDISLMEMIPTPSSSKFTSSTFFTPSMPSQGSKGDPNLRSALKKTPLRSSSLQTMEEDEADGDDEFDDEILEDRETILHRLDLPLSLLSNVDDDYLMSQSTRKKKKVTFG